MEFKKREKSVKETVISFRLAEKEYKRIKSLAKHYGLTMTEMIRQFVNQQYEEEFGGKDE